MTAGKISVRPLFIFLAAGITLVLGVPEGLAVLAAAVIHELGHLAAIALTGGDLIGMELGGAGVEIAYEGRGGRLADAIVALSGPAASALGAMAGAGAYALTSLGVFSFFAGVNGVYALLNLIPMSPMDGGRVLWDIVSSVFGDKIAWKVQNALDITGLAAIFVLGIYAFAKTGRNVTLLLCAILLCDACC